MVACLLACLARSLAYLLTSVSCETVRSFSATSRRDCGRAEPTRFCLRDKYQVGLETAFFFFALFAAVWWVSFNPSPFILTHVNFGEIFQMQLNWIIIEMELLVIVKVTWTKLVEIRNQKVSFKRYDHVYARNMVTKFRAEMKGVAGGRRLRAREKIRCR